MDSKYDADTKIADAAREYQMQKANYDMEVNAAVGPAQPYKKSVFQLQCVRAGVENFRKQKQSLLTSCKERKRSKRLEAKRLKSRRVNS